MAKIRSQNSLHFGFFIIIMILSGQYCPVQSIRMINLYVAAAPHFSGGPVRIFIGPERVRDGKAQRQEYGAAQVQASHIDIALRQFGLTSADSRLQPAVLIKHFLVFHTSADNRGQCTADLGGASESPPVDVPARPGTASEKRRNDSRWNVQGLDSFRQARSSVPERKHNVRPGRLPFFQFPEFFPRFTNISARSKYMGWITKLL